MAQTTLDRVTGQARSMMQRGQQQMIRARQAARANGTPANWRMPARVAWHAGKLVGQVQGARTLAPHAARGWWLGVAGRGGTRSQQLGRMARVAGITFVGTRVVSRALPTLRDLRKAASKSRLGRTAQQRSGVPRNGSVPTGALRYVTAPVPTLIVPATAAIQQATQQTWRRVRRSQPVAVVTPAPWWGRPGWMWPASLAAGFTLGILIGYLFTPAGPGYAQMSKQQGRPDARFTGG